MDAGPKHTTTRKNNWSGTSMSNKIITSKILDEKKETKNVKTIYFYHPDPISPGQFYMIWIPGVDEIPMSVSQINKNQKAITFKAVGEATEALFQKTINDKIGIRGPYGNGFSLKGEHILFVAGGTGIAMIAPAVEQTIQEHKQTTVLIGAKTREDLFFVDRLKQINATVYVTTDDGSRGKKGYVTSKAETLLKSKTFDAVYTCGPEKMMERLYQICENKNIIFEASLERYMKCGVGLCGQCVVGKGIRVCVEGPVFSKSTLSKIPDFGVFKRDISGKKQSL